MNDNRKIVILTQPDGFLVMVAGDELAEPYLSVHPTLEEAMSEALQLRKAGEFKGALVVDETNHQLGP